jgi:hypothetical protein
MSTKKSNDPWDPWIKMQQGDFRKIRRGLKRLPEEQRQLYALAFSVAKWHPKNDPWEYDNCGLCILNDLSNHWGECGDCCLYKLWKGVGCLDDAESPYGAWLNSAGGYATECVPTKEAQAAMFKDIFKLYKKEWKKFYG